MLPTGGAPNFGLAAVTAPMAALRPAAPAAPPPAAAPPPPPPLGAASPGGAPAPPPASALATAGSAGPPGGGGGGAAGPGGRGAGPDHRDARPAEAMAAMISVLRPLPLAARTWDVAAYKASGMRRAARPAAGGGAGKEAALLSNHFLLSAPRGARVAEYEISACRVGGAAAGSGEDGGEAGEGGGVSAAASAGGGLPPRLVELLAARAAAAAGWPPALAAAGAARRAYAPAPVPGGGGGAAAAAAEAEVVVSEEEAERPEWAGAYEVKLTLLGEADLSPPPPAAAPAASSPSRAPPPAGSPPPAGAAAAVAAGELVPAALRALGAAVRQALVSRGGGSPAAVAAALAAAAAAPPPAAAAAPEAVAAPKPADAATDGAAAAAPPPAAPDAPGAAAAPPPAPPPAAALPLDTPCVDAAGAVCLYAPSQPDCHAPLGGGAEAWVGFSHRVVPTAAGPAAVLDVECRAFARAGPLPALAEALLGAAACCGGGGGADGGGAAAAAAESEGDRKLLEAVVVGLQVDVSLPGGAPPARRAVRALAPGGAGGAPAPAGSESPSALEHFESALGRPLRHPGLPCVDVGRGEEAEWVPAELCSVLPGQPFARLDDQQAEALARFAARRPPERRALLEAFLAGGARLASGALAGGLGLEAPASPPAVRGRVLPPPYLSYTTPECMYPGTQGQWSLHVLKPAAPKPVASWACVSLMPREEADVPGPAGLSAFLADLASTLAAAGMECTPPPVVYADPAASVLHHMRAGCEAAQQQYGQPCQLLLVLMRSRSGPLYSEVKMASDAALGLPSQCMVAPSAGVGAGAAPRGRLLYCYHLLLSINAKLGGVNHRLAGDPAQVIPTVGVRPFMLFGAAAAQPPPAAAARGERAAAAVVASRDRSLGRYSSRVLLQPAAALAAFGDASDAPIDASASASAWAGGLAIAGLTSAARELLVDFYRVNGARKPEALIVYRHWSWPPLAPPAGGGGGGGGAGCGVEAEEAARRAVVEAEYAALRRACFDLEEGYCPPITFILASRHHATRLFPADRDGADKSGNAPPGTVVDGGITSPTSFDFYLNSHAGSQGHNRAAHYQVAVDESGFCVDGIQLLTYWLTFLFARCTRSVSIAPPAYYADLAAQRGLLLSSRGAGAGGVDDLYPSAAGAGAGAGTGAGAGGAGGSGDAAVAAAAAPADVRVHPRLGGTMHYL